MSDLNPHAKKRAFLSLQSDIVRAYLKDSYFDELRTSIGCKLEPKVNKEVRVKNQIAFKTTIQNYKGEFKF